MGTAHLPCINVEDAIVRIFFPLQEIYSVNPLSCIGHLCDGKTRKCIDMGLTAEKRGLTSYLISGALYGFNCKDPLIKHKNEEGTGCIFYNNAVVPMVLFLQRVMQCQCNSKEGRFSATAVLNNNFWKWSQTLKAKQRKYGVWSVEYMLERSRNRDDQSEVHIPAPMVKGVYYPMHCALFRYTVPYKEQYNIHGNYITVSQAMQHDRLERERSISFGSYLT